MAAVGIATGKAPQSTLFCGCVSVAVAIVLCVAATAKQDIRWIVVIAWLLMLVAIWEFTRYFSGRGSVLFGSVAAGAIVLGGALMWLYFTLGPPEVVIANPPSAPSPAENELLRHNARALSAEIKDFYSQNLHREFAVSDDKNLSADEKADKIKKIEEDRSNQFKKILDALYSFRARVA
jgi:hypothetical protein